MTLVTDVVLRRVLDSRGNPTVEADIRTESGGLGRACAPSGASTGGFEAVELPAREAIAAAREHAVPRLLDGVYVGDQRSVDRALRAADGTDDFSRIGANSAVALSMAAAFANAAVHDAVGDLLADRGVAAGKGDEGAWAPAIADSEALAVLAEAVDSVAADVGFEMRMGLDIAATELYDETAGVYRYGDTARSPDEQLAHVAELIETHDLVYVEDPLTETEFAGFATLTERVGGQPPATAQHDGTLLCGDDLFVTSVERLTRGIEAGAANSILVKPNQVGTLTGAFDAIERARTAGYRPVVSHRSGETEDTTIAHLAVATGAPYLKTGTVGGERTAKLNELIRIEHNA